MNDKWIFILSSMRAGSTLLKALLATRADVSDLPEVSFDGIYSITCAEPIKVLKMPAGWTEVGYPSLPDIESKKIILIRNPYDTVVSMQEMMKAVYPKRPKLTDEKRLLSYWVSTYKSIMNKFYCDDRSDTILVRYEDLIDQTIDSTARIFAFIGCNDVRGTDSYSRPDSYDWQWGEDDGGEVIKTLKVQKGAKSRDNMKLKKLINGSSEIKVLMQSFGYKNQEI